MSPIIFILFLILSLYGLDSYFKWDLLKDLKLLDSQYYIIHTTSDLILYLTLLIVLFYTIETYLLKRETREQTKIMSLPCPFIYFNDDKLKLVNLGKSSLVNWEIEKWRLIENEGFPKILDRLQRVEFFHVIISKSSSLIFKFIKPDKNKVNIYEIWFELPDKKPFLKPNYSVELIPKLNINGKSQDRRLAEFMGPHLDPNYSKFVTNLKVYFKNSLGKRYVCVISFGLGQMEMIKSYKKIRTLSFYNLKRINSRFRSK